MSKRSEPVQRRNPYHLTTRQHVFPRKSIARFADERGFVSLIDQARRINRRAKPGDKVFCADRAWDERAEKGYMKSAEDEFQKLADGILDDGVSSLTASDNQIVNMFYGIWHVRSRQRVLPMQFIKMKEAEGSDFSQDLFERLESQWTIAFRKDGSVPSRHINAIQIQVMAGQIAQVHLRDAKWGIVRSIAVEFCVPDVPHMLVVPISPKVCLVQGAPSGYISDENAMAINRATAFTAREYYFARDMNKCAIRAADIGHVHWAFARP